MSENKYYDKTNPKDLMPKEILDNVPKLYEQDGVKAKDKVVHVAYIIPFRSNWTWYLNEYDEKSGRAFGLVAGDFVEWGYFDVNELEELGAERLILEDFPKTFEEIKDTELKKQLTEEELDLVFNGELSFAKEEKSVDLIKEIIISDLKEKDVNEKGAYKYDSENEVYILLSKKIGKGEDNKPKFETIVGRDLHNYKQGYVADLLLDLKNREFKQNIKLDGKVIASNVAIKYETYEDLENALPYFLDDNHKDVMLDGYVYQKIEDEKILLENFYEDVKAKLSSDLDDISYDGNIDGMYTTDLLWQETKDNCSDFATDYRNADYIISDMISEFADGRVDIYSSELWKKGYDYRFFTEEAIEEGLISLSSDVSMDKVLQAGQFLACERGIHENITEIAKSMTIQNVLDDVDAFKEELIELGRNMTEEEKDDFFSELDDYIELVSEEIASDDREITDLETIDFGSFETMIENYEERVEERLSDKPEKEETISKVREIGEVEEKKSDNPLLENLKLAIVDFCKREYGDENYNNKTFDTLFPDKKHIGIAYTNTPDELHSIQAELNLDDFTFNQYVDDKLITTYSYDYGNKGEENAIRNMLEEMQVGVFEEFVSVDEKDLKKTLGLEINDEGNYYDPLAKDLDNDGIADRYDNDFKDSDYLESTFDIDSIHKDDKPSIIGQIKVFKDDEVESNRNEQKESDLER